MKTIQKRGFTLVELLIVVSIIALLIGILLPALAEARRTARLVVDVANVNEHGKGAQSYAAENKDALPNGEKFWHSAPDIGTARPKLWPHWVYCGPYSSAGANGASGPTNGIGLSQEIQFANTWKFYTPQFGNYIYDAEGVDLLFADIFTSPGSNQRAAHKFYQRTSKEDPRGSQDFLMDTQNFNVSQNAFRNFNKPWFGELGQDGDAWALTGSYRYTVSALVGDSNVSYGNFGGTNFFSGYKSQTAGGAGVGAAPTPWAQAGVNWGPWRTYVKTKSFAFPAEKVLFWDLDAANTPAGFYAWPGAKIAVNTIDGGTRQVEPYKIMPLSREDVLEAKGRFSESIATIEMYQRNWNSAGPDPKMAEGGYNSGAPAWFAMTTDGPSGRDLGLEAYIDISTQ
ncbi:MAG: type II secretion system protein [Phycisphaerales bacterium JB043]